MIHRNPVRVCDGYVYTDRKFLTGMAEYAHMLDAPIVTVNPALKGGERIMDPATVPIDSLGYDIVPLSIRGETVERVERARLRDVVSNSRLVVGAGLGALSEARRVGVPYVMVLEYDLATRITVSTLQVRSRLRRQARRLKAAWRHHWSYLPEVRAARSILCNGYPVFDEVTPHNQNCVLYLDSRMSRDLVISEDDLERRLSARVPDAPLRVLYSGRYEPMKGALDAVRTAIACRAAGVRIEFDCYGQGSQLQAMRAAINEAEVGAFVRVHDPLPYSELAKIAQAFDAFLCCHVQHDPSCTYLESLGAGLPIVGYGNRMWTRMCAESRAGILTPIGGIEANVEALRGLARNPDRLADFSREAISFAAAHSFEAEFSRRIGVLGAEYESAILQ